VAEEYEKSNSKLSKLLVKYRDLFRNGIGCLTQKIATLSIKPQSTPTFIKARPIPFAMRSKEEKELEKLERDGIISKIEMSDWASPIVPVLKKDGSVRICDFKVTVNQVVQVDQYPLPRIEDIFATLGGGRKFAKLDIRQAYLHIPLDEDSKKLLAIITHKRFYEYNRLTFGIASAPSIWQRAMDQILQGLSGVHCVLDDMIFTGKNDDEHLQNLENVLQRLQDNIGLRANIEKCSCLQDSAVHCGHEISKEGLQKTKDKVEAAVNTPAPKNTTQLRPLLGLVNYYHKFLPNLATEIHPLNELLDRDRTWVWNECCNRAFLKVNDMITSDGVLTHYDPNLPVRLACDASPYGLRSVLSHVMTDGTERPVAFASRSLTKSERNYAQIDKEALGIVWSVKKFYTYLFRRSFTLVTDH
jgi:hypothetical protein